MRPLEVNYLKGNNSNTTKKLKWKPKIKFEKLVEIMLNEDIKRWEQFLDGTSFAWDAPLYPDENKNTRLPKKQSSRNFKHGR